MLSKVFNVELNIRHEQGHKTDITVNQGDTRSVVFNFRVFDGANEINYREVDKAVVFFLKPDKSVVQGEIFALENGGFTHTLSKQTVASSGAVTAGLALYGATGVRITTMFFIFWVKSDIISSDIIESTSEFDALRLAMTVMEWLLSQYESFPHLNVLGRFKTEEELRSTFPDGSNISGGFFVGSGVDARYFYWSIKTSSWENADPWRGEPGRHWFTINTPHTAQQLHDMGMRAGDSVVIVAPVVVLGEEMSPGTVLERVSDEITETSWKPMGSIRGLQGAPAALNPRGIWNSTITDYERNDLVVFQSDAGENTYFYNSEIPRSQIPPHEPDSPWVIFIRGGGTSGTTDIELPLSIENGGTGTNDASSVVRRFANIAELEAAGVDINNVSTMFAYSVGIDPATAASLRLIGTWYQLEFEPHVELGGFGVQTITAYMGEQRKYRRVGNGSMFGDWLQIYSRSLFGLGLSAPRPDGAEAVITMAIDLEPAPGNQAVPNVPQCTLDSLIPGQTYLPLMLRGNGIYYQCGVAGLGSPVPIWHGRNFQREEGIWTCRFGNATGTATIHGGQSTYTRNGDLIVAEFNFYILPWDFGSIPEGGLEILNLPFPVRKTYSTPVFFSFIQRENYIGLSARPVINNTNALLVLNLNTFQNPDTTQGRLVKQDIPETGTRYVNGSVMYLTY